MVLTCVAGGERTGADMPPAGRETVAIVKRRLEFKHGAWVDLANTRPIIALFDCDDVAIKWGPK